MLSVGRLPAPPPPPPGRTCASGPPGTRLQVLRPALRLLAAMRAVTTTRHHLDAVTEAGEGIAVVEEAIGAFNEAIDWCRLAWGEYIRCAADNLLASL